ncbi:hypothetical protein [Beijerinckia sp. L45]|nr:hypothetical protein [Beijerinckia sp. L45]
MQRTILRLACLLVVTLGAAGCDKCGTPVKFNAPSVPNACGANADESR